METTTAETIETLATELGLSMAAHFVPFSRSRSKKEKTPSLNWVVTIAHKGKPFLTTEYMMGSGHCPGYKQCETYESKKITAWECENGVEGWITSNERIIRHGGNILPKLADVLHSLASDASAIDYASFEAWANEMGDDPDSRRAEQVYRACLDTALKLRAALGEDGLTRLRDGVQDY
jgi:hypothetical protein